MKDKLSFIAAALILSILSCAHLISWSWLPKKQIHNYLGFQITTTSFILFLVSIGITIWFFGGILIALQKKPPRRRTTFPLDECWK